MQGLILHIDFHFLSMLDIKGGVEARFLKHTQTFWLQKVFRVFQDEILAERPKRLSKSKGTLTLLIKSNEWLHELTPILPKINGEKKWTDDILFCS